MADDPIFQKDDSRGSRGAGGIGSFGAMQQKVLRGLFRVNVLIKTFLKRFKEIAPNEIEKKSADMFHDTEEGKEDIKEKSKK